MEVVAEPSSRREQLQWAGLVAGPLAAVVVYFLLPDSYSTQGEMVELTHEARATAAIAAWMATWWLTEAVEVPVTALLPLVLFPLTGALSGGEAAGSYANELVFLFLGGFILARSMQRWGLDRRIALATLRLTGSGPRSIVGGLMLATALMSMWVSNTATAALMLPVVLGVTGRVMGSDAEDREAFATAALLGVAYAASIGGLATIIGSPPNVFLVSYIETARGEEVSLVEWMAIGVPAAAFLLPFTWLLLTRVLYRLPATGGEPVDLAEDFRQLGRPSPGEWVTFLVFCATVSLWISRPLVEDISIAGREPFSGVSDATIAIAAALALFVIPVAPRSRTFAMDWETASHLPWGVLILFGGGLSLALALDRNGIGSFLAAQVEGFDALPLLLLVVLVVALVIFLTEITSNTATAATLIPVFAGLAPGLGVHPYLLIFPVALSASAAFMMPVATPPNAIVFGSGHVTIPQMARAGLILNLVAIAVVSSAAYWLLPLVFGIDRSG